MAKTKKTEEPLEAPVLVTEETVAPVEAPKAKEIGAPDKIEVTFKEAFKAITFDNLVWYVYAKDGRRLTGGITEDEAVRLVRGFGVR